MFSFLAEHVRLRDVLLRVRAEKTSDPRPDIARLLFFAVSLMDIGLPQKHVELVLLQFGYRLSTRYSHIVSLRIYTVLRMSTKNWARRDRTLRIHRKRARQIAVFVLRCPTEAIKKRLRSESGETNGEKNQKNREYSA